MPRRSWWIGHGCVRRRRRATCWRPTACSSRPTRPTSARCSPRPGGDEASTRTPSLLSAAMATRSGWPGSEAPLPPPAATREPRAVTPRTERRLLAVDLGAESGRVVLGGFDGERLGLEEVHRFPNVPGKVAGTLYWDVLRLFTDVLDGVRRAGQVDSIGVDTWGVDFALLDR